jgi:hypothetical protein
MVGRYEYSVSGGSLYEGEENCCRRRRREGAKAKDLVEGAHITSSSIEGGKYYDEEEAMTGSY